MASSTKPSLSFQEFQNFIITIILAYPERNFLNIRYSCKQLSLRFLTWQLEQTWACQKRYWIVPECDSHGQSRTAGLCVSGPWHHSTSTASQSTTSRTTRWHLAATKCQENSWLEIDCFLTEAPWNQRYFKEKDAS